jgi:hypothetical protein
MHGFNINRSSWHTRVDFMQQITLRAYNIIIIIHHSQSLDGAERVVCLDRLDEFDPLPSVGTLN